MCLGVPGKIIEIDDSAELLMAKVVIHVGFAISLLSEEEAQESLAMLKEIIDLEEELGDE